MSPSGYRPVDCGLHSSYELLIMQHRSCRLDWYDATGAMHTRIVVPTDLYTRNSEEFMIVTDAAGVTHTIRLDRIRHCTPS